MLFQDEREETFPHHPLLLVYFLSFCVLRFVTMGRLKGGTIDAAYKFD